MILSPFWNIFQNVHVIINAITLICIWILFLKSDDNFGSRPKTAYPSLHRWMKQSGCHGKNTRYIVLDQFWWNLAGWFIMIKDRFLSKMSLIGPLKRKLHKTRIYIFIYYVPLIIFFWCNFPLFIIGEVRCNKLFKKRPKTLKMGRARYVFYWTHQILVLKLKIKIFFFW